MLTTEDFQQIRTFIYSVGIPQTIIAGLSGFLGSLWLWRIIQNQKRLDDARLETIKGDIISRIEGIKINLNKNLFKFSKTYETVFSFYKEMWELISRLETDVGVINIIMEKDSDVSNEMQVAAFKLNESLQKSAKAILYNKPFFPILLFDKIDEMYGICVVLLDEATYFSANSSSKENIIKRKGKLLTIKSINIDICNLIRKRLSDYDIT